jgi:glutaconate CoA-transferase subunit B
MALPRGEDPRVLPAPHAREAAGGPDRDRHSHDPDADAAAPDPGAVSVDPGLEMLLVAAAREIGDGELVFVSEPLGRAAFALASRAHAPRAFALHPAGTVTDHTAPAAMMGDLQAVMSLLHQGRVDVGFLAPGEVDRFGNINATRLGEVDLLGGPLIADAAAADVASLARRTLVLVPHDRDRLRERIHYVTGVGHGGGEGTGSRARAGLPPGGPAAIITDLAVIRFDERGVATLSSVHPGKSREQVLAATGFELESPADVPQTPAPTPLETNLIRAIAPAAAAAWAARTRILA